MMKPKKIAMKRKAAVASVLVALAALAAALHNQYSDAKSSAEPLAFRLRDGASKAYDFAFTTVMTPVGGKAAPTEVALDGRLNIRVVQGESGAMLGVQLSPLQAHVARERQPNMEKVLSVPFVVEIDARGQLGASRFPPELAQGDRAILDGAIRSMQIVLPPEPVERWETTETDQNGAYVASYSRVEGTRGLEKRKVRYESLRTGGMFAIVVLESSIRAELDSEGPWLRRLEGMERIQLDLSGNQARATVNGRFKLEPAHGAPAPALALWRDDVLRSARVPRDEPSRASASAFDEATREKLRQRFVDSRVGLDELLRRAGSEESSNARELAAYLGVFPDEARQIPQKLRGLDERASARLVHALELAGTPQAQEALAQVMESRDETRDNRIRSLVAMGGLEQPTAATIERLTRAAHAPDRTGDAGDVSSTALLTLGALAPKAPEDTRPGIVQSLTDDLRAERDAGRERVLLLALENAGERLPEDTLRSYVESKSADVREVATRLMAAQSSTADVIALHAGEQDALVRGSAIDGLLRRPPDAEANAAIVRALSEGREPDPGLRARMVGYLALHMEAFPQNRDVLQSHLPREKDRGVTVAILNSLAR